MKKYIKLVKRHFLSTLCSLCLLTLLVIYVTEDSYVVRESDLFGEYYGFDNESGVNELIVPNYVHYIFFDRKEINFITFLSMVSAVKIQKPERLYIHTETGEAKGRYFELLQNLVNTSIPGRYNTTIICNRILRPSHVYGVKLSSVYHASDVARISVLATFGGIYLDTDLLVLKNLDTFRHFEMTLGWPDGYGLGTQILIAAKGARFLKIWLSSYTYYNPRKWYFNAGILPTTAVLSKYPELVHREQYVLGVELIHREIWKVKDWDGWKDLYSLHLLIRHTPSPDVVTEHDYLSCDCAFKDMAKMILHEIPPNIDFKQDLK